MYISESDRSSDSLVPLHLSSIRSELDSARNSSRGLVNYVSLSSEDDLNDWIESVRMDRTTFYKSIGTIGGGNHFMEYDEGDGRFAFTVHTGSRHLGLKVFNKWDSIARQNPNAPGYLVDENLKGYLTDMVIAQAKVNIKAADEKKTSLRTQGND